MANIEVKKLLTDFEKVKELKRVDGFFVEDARNIYPVFSTNKTEDSYGDEYDDYHVKKYMVNGKPVYVKQYKGEEKIFSEILHGRIFNDCGVNSVYSYPLLVDDDFGFFTSRCGRFFLEEEEKWYDKNVFSQDVNSLGLTCVRGDRVIDKLFSENFLYFKKEKIQNPFVCLEDELLFREEITKNTGNPFISIENNFFRQMLLEVMTSECLDELDSLIVGAIVEGLNDVHSENVFFYKTNPKASKFDGLILIDNEGTIWDSEYYKLLNHVLTNGTGKDAYKYLLKKATVGWSPFAYMATSHEQNIQKIKELVADGKLGPNQIKLLKKLIDYDYIKQASRVLNSYSGLNVPAERLEMGKYLIDFNRRNLELENVHVL